MKSRTFRAGEVASDQKNNSMWTETPAERAKRAAEGDQVRKILDLLFFLLLPQSNLIPDQPASKKKKIEGEDDPAVIQRNMEMSKVVQEYNEKHRPQSLMEEYHQKHINTRSDKDDPTKRSFDREKDLGFRRYDPVKRSEFISKSGSSESLYFHRSSTHDIALPHLVTESSSRFKKGGFS